MYIFIGVIGAILGFSIAAAITNSKITDLELEIYFLRKQRNIIQERIEKLEKII